MPTYIQGPVTTRARCCNLNCYWADQRVAVCQILLQLMDKFLPLHFNYFLLPIKAVVKRLTEPKPTVSSQNLFSTWNRFQVLAQDEAEILLKTLKTWVKLIMTNIKLIKNHYCSVTFSKIMSGNRLISTLYDWRKWTLRCLIQANWYKSDEKIGLTIGYTCRLTKKPTGFGGRITVFWNKQNITALLPIPFQVILKLAGITSTMNLNHTLNC